MVQAVLTRADEAGAAPVDQVIVVGQDEGAALLDLQAVLVARDLLLTGLLGGGEELRTQPGLVGHLGGGGDGGGDHSIG